MKVIIAHAGQQTSFRRAEALKKSGYLAKYITTVYLKNTSGTILRLLRSVNKSEAERLAEHNCKALDSNDVKTISTMKGLVLTFVNRFDRKRMIYSRMNYIFSHSFAKKVAKYAVKEEIDALIMMGSAPYGAFRYLNNINSNIVKIFDMSSVAYNYQTMIMQKERDNLPIEWREYIVRDKEDKLTQLLMRNITYADQIIVSSTFAKQSLIVNKVPENKIHVIPYGIENVTRSNTARYKKGEKLKLLYVGSVSCEKGIYYLLEAVSSFSKEQVELVVVGKKYIPNELLTKYSSVATFIGDVPHKEIVDYYCASHILIVPTLFDSFGRVITEALSYGLPIIATSSAGAADYIENGYNGFVVPPSDVNSIENRIQFFLDNPAKVEEFGANAHNIASTYTWDRYYKKYGEVIAQICTSKNSRLFEYEV